MDILSLERDLARGEDKEILKRLASSKDNLTRYLVANNLSSGVETLDYLSGDKADYIRSAAKRTLKKIFQMGGYE